jgi:hypothetical protein
MEREKKREGKKEEIEDENGTPEIAVNLTFGFSGSF